ncbi:DNA-directed RNA polymerase III subunit RPC8 isoform X2 [Anas acuta]|uniref:DNA-directed RNA polymerase III subunit RPC8 isoform X2 n=1 Tax=Anas platyrhynchos TaxID=8839 RepID=UPI0003510AAB|nr:DNA-directed RNA polymerase III subunit RPC8 isoform X2 [Anas platyrhynchos]
MFVLVEMTDTVRIPPWQFERQLNESIAEELNKKLANKVVYNVGLCICLYDITKLEDSYIFPGDGASHTKVHFRYVVFHPFLDEILIGEIKSCSQDGVHGTSVASDSFLGTLTLPALLQAAFFFPSGQADRALCCCMCFSWAVASLPTEMEHCDSKNNSCIISAVLPRRE